MPDTFTVKVHGLDELERELNALPDKLAKGAIRTASRKAGQILQREAISRAPARTGALRKGIGVSTKVRTEGISGATIETRIGLRGRVFYGRFLEFGTKTIGKIPFLGPAFEAVKERMLDTFKVELRNAINRIKVKNRIP